MTRVCLVGKDDNNLQYELLSRETARDALVAYDLYEPFENSIAIETVSLGAAVALLNDLDWYLTRFVDDAFVLEPSISDSEWLSRRLATAIRNNELEPEETARFLRVYGVKYNHDPGDENPAETQVEENSPENSTGDDSGQSDGSTVTERSTDVTNSAGDSPSGVGNSHNSGAPDSGYRGEPPALVEPMLVARTDETIPTYDLREVDETLVVRVTEDEFGA